jgi:hypothetical protein
MEMLLTMGMYFTYKTNEVPGKNKQRNASDIKQNPQSENNTNLHNIKI